MPILRSISLFVIDFLETIAVSLIIFFFLNQFVFQPHEVNGLSMYPTFYNNDRLLTSRFSYRFGQPQFGDVIVFRAPGHEEYDYIKRIIGMPGDKIKIDEGDVYRNGELLDESLYLNNTVKTYGEAYLRNGEETTVPDQSYFVMGDNRDNSSDSRNFGPVPYKNIVGKAWIRYWPPQTFGLIKHVSNS